MKCFFCFPASSGILEERGQACETTVQQCEPQASSGADIRGFNPEYGLVLCGGQEGLAAIHSKNQELQEPEERSDPAENRHHSTHAACK